MDTNKPDTLAAAFDPDRMHTATVGDLTEDDVDSVIEIDGRTMTLVEPPARDEDGRITLVVRIADNPFHSALPWQPAYPYRLISAPVRVTDMVDMDDFHQQARELDRLGKLILAREAELPVLRTRKRELADKLLEQMVALGEKNIYFDDRRTYIFPELFPEFEQRDDGTKYTMRDLVPVLRSLGCDGAIKPEEARFDALLRIFREHAQAGKPLPPELAAMVGPRVVHTVRVGVGKTG